MQPDLTPIPTSLGQHALATSGGPAFSPVGGLLTPGDRGTSP